MKKIKLLSCFQQYYALQNLEIIWLQVRFINNAKGDASRLQNENEMLSVGKS